MAIINDNFFDALGKGATWAAGVAFQRSNPLPLDKYSVFETRALAEEYATTNAVAYPGQVVAFVEDGEMKVCVLAETANEVVEGEEQTYSLGLQEIGGKIDLDNTSLSFNEETGLLEISGFDGAATATLPQKKIAEDGTETIEWVTVDAIVEGDGNTTYTVTPLKKNVGTEEAPVEEIYGFTLTPSEGAATEIKLDVYTKTEVDGAISTAVEAEETRATAAEAALDAKIGTASEGTVGDENYKAATGIMADIEALETLKADVTYVDDEIAGLEDAISKLNHFTTEIVSSTDDVKAEGILYLIKDESVEGVDKYNEYLFVDGEAVLIGDTTTDLSNYYDKDEIDGKVTTLEGKITDEATARGALAEKVADLEAVDNATQDELDAYKGEVTTALGLKANASDVASTYVTKDEAGMNLETDKGIRFINQSEIDKLSKLNLSGDEITISGSVNASQVEGLYAAVEKMVTSTNTTEDLDSKVDGTQAAFGIEKGAQVNKIEKVVFNGTEATIADKVATIAGEYYTESEVDAKIKTVADTLAEVQTTANTAKGAAEANSAEITPLKASVNDHATRIGAIETTISEQTGKLTTLETTVGGKADQTTVDGINTKVGENTGKISNIEGSIAGINTTLTGKANASDVYTKTEIDNKTGVIAEGKTLVQMISDAQTAATYNDSELRGLIGANTTAIQTLNGDDKTPGSVDYKVAQEVAKILNDNDGSDIDTLNEIAAWITNDTTGAAKMNADIAANTAAIAALTQAAPKIATTTVAGLVLSVANTVENGVAVAEDGTMSVNSLNVNKLVQTEGEYLVLDGGGAAGATSDTPSEE